MKGESSGSGTAVRAGVATCGRAGAEDGEGAEATDDRMLVVEADEAATATGVEAITAGAASNLVPHIPQKRFSSELSLPQRGQRTSPPYTLI